MRTVAEHVVAQVRRWLLAAADLVLPSRCAACHGAGGPLCRTCADAVRSACHGVAAGGVTLHPAPPAMPQCWAGARFEGPLRLAVTAYKDEGRRDLRDDLARLLGAALTAATDDPALRRRLASGEEVLVVPVPASRASRRRRGDDPVGGLARSATAAVNRSGTVGERRSARSPLADQATGGLVVAPALVHTRAVADQAHLDRDGQGSEPRRCDGGRRGVASGGRRGRLRGRRRRRHDRCDPRRGHPGPARCGGPTRRRRGVRDHTSALTGPALVAHRTSD